MSDAINLAMVFSSWGTRSETPLITNTRAVRHASEELSLRRGMAGPIAISPLTTLNYFGLEKASTSDIQKLLDEAKWISKALSETQPRHQIIELGERLEEYVDFVLRLAEVSSSISGTWKAPLDGFPSDLGPQKIAELLLEVSQTFARNMTNVAARLNRIADPFREFAVTEASSSTSWGPIGRALRFLDGLPGRESPVVIQVFQQFAAEGAAMSIYNVSQTGNNNTAIVDSFKTSIESGPAFTKEAQEALADFLSSVQDSSLLAKDKDDVIEAATSVVQSVKKEGKLAGSARFVWEGVSKTISLIPAAIKAWEALHTIWG